jgi:hypothetical protein
MEPVDVHLRRFRDISVAVFFSVEYSMCVVILELHKIKSGVEF